MVQRMSKAMEKVPDVHLSKKWTIAGILIALSGFFLHPEACISSRNIIEFFTPDSVGDAASHFGVIIGGILAILGKGLMEKK